MVSPNGERLIARRYRLLRKIGQGGMGAVWEGRDTLLDRPIAVKEVLLPPGRSAVEHERQLLRTAREARAAARLNHPGIVAIYDVAEEDGKPWIIMELVRAEPLDELVAAHGALPVRQAADVGRQVLSALRAAHAAGILHRDVKPGNILVAPDGRAVLTDFGIATVEGDSSLTQTGMVAGSPAFLAPERARGRSAGPESDLWSLGATLYAALLGRSPFDRGDTMATLGALLTEEPDYSRVPPVLHPVLKGLLQRDPAQRLGAAEADALLTEITSGGAPTRRMPRAGRSAERGGRRRAALLVAAAAVLAGGATVGWVTLGPGGVPATGQTAGVGAEATGSATPGVDPMAVKASATPTPTPTQTPAAAAVAAVRRYVSPSGWSIRFPRGWKGSRAEAYTEWLSRDRAAHLGVEEVSATLGEDPMSLLRTGEQVMTSQMEDLETIRRDAVSFSGGAAAEWEFTYVPGAVSGVPWAVPGQRYRELRRAIVVGDSAFILEWTTVESEWDDRRRLLRQAFRGFSAGG